MSDHSRSLLVKLTHYRNAYAVRVPTCPSFSAFSCTSKLGAGIDSAMESYGLSRRRSRVRAPSLPPLLSMSNWEPVKIRDTPRFSTVTLLIGLRSRYLPLASGTSRRRNQGCLLGCAAGICLDRASGGDENYSN